MELAFQRIGQGVVTLFARVIALAWTILYKATQYPLSELNRQGDKRKAPQDKDCCLEIKTPGHLALKIKQALYFLTHRHCARRIQQLDPATPISPRWFLPLLFFWLWSARTYYLSILLRREWFFVTNSRSVGMSHSEAREAVSILGTVLITNDVGLRGRRRVRWRRAIA